MGVITLRSDSERRRRAEAALQRLRPVVADEAERALGRADAVGFLARLDLWFLDLHGPLEALYGDDEDDELVARAGARSRCAAAEARPAELRELDRRREIDPRWYQRAAHASATSATSTGSAARSTRCPSAWTTSPSWASPTCT